MSDAVKTRRSYPVRQAIEGFLVGIAIFAALSYVAPQTWNALSESACTLQPGAHFPSGLCLVGESLASTLWLGPASPFLVLLMPHLRSLAPIFLASALIVGFAAAILFGRYGRRRGLFLLIAGSVPAIFVVSVFYSFFMVFA